MDLNPGEIGLSGRHKLVIGLLFLLLLSAMGCLTPSTRPKNAEDYPELMRAKVVELALALRGCPYQLGGGEIDGVDCSGFLRYVFHAFGYASPREAKVFAKIKPSLGLSQIKAADVLVFRSQKVWHVGLYVGKNRFVHAPSQGNVVREESLNDFWTDQLVRVVRIITD